MIGLKMATAAPDLRQSLRLVFITLGVSGSNLEPGPVNFDRPGALIAECQVFWL